MQTLLGYAAYKGDIEIVNDLIARPGIDLSLGVRHIFSLVPVHEKIAHGTGPGQVSWSGIVLCRVSQDLTRNGSFLSHHGPTLPSHALLSPSQFPLYHC